MNHIHPFKNQKKKLLITMSNQEIINNKTRNRPTMPTIDSKTDEDKKSFKNNTIHKRINNRKKAVLRKKSSSDLCKEAKSQKQTTQTYSEMMEESQRQQQSIESLYKFLKEQVKTNKKNNNYVFNKLFRERNVLNSIKNIIKNTKKNKKEEFILVNFLRTLNNVIDTISPEKCSTDALISLLKNIGQNLKYIEVDEGKFLFHIDDVGKKFYIIIEGEVSVLLSKFYTKKMDEQEYVNHLLFLFQLREKYLFYETLKANVQKFPNINEYHIIEKEKIFTNFLTQNKNMRIDKLLEYINGIVPLPYNHNNYNNILDENEDFKTTEVKICGYNKIVELKEGNSFGEMALKNQKSLRTASIYTNNNCFLAYLDVENYNKSMKSFQLKTKSDNIKFILTTGIFDNMTVDFFEKKYWSLFCKRETTKGQILFNVGEKYKGEVLWIFSGEVALESSLSMISLEKILKELKPKKYEENDSMLENNLNSINDSAIFNIGFFAMGEILGLDNIIYRGKYFCTAKCNSEKCIYFSLQREYFDGIIKKYPLVQKKYKKYISMKKEYIFKALLRVKQNLYQTKKNNIGIKEIKNDLFNLEEKTIKLCKTPYKIKDSDFTISNKEFLNKNNNTLRLKTAKSVKHLKNFCLLIENSDDKNDMSKRFKKYKTIFEKRLVNINEKKFKEQKKLLRFESANVITTLKNDKNENQVTKNFYNNVVFGYRYNTITLNKEKIKKTYKNFLKVDHHRSNNSKKKINFFTRLNSAQPTLTTPNLKYSSFNYVNFLAYEDKDKNHRSNINHKTVSITIPNVVKYAHLYCGNQTQNKGNKDLINLLKNEEKRRSSKNFFIKDIQSKNINGFLGSHLFNKYKWNLKKFKEKNFNDGYCNIYFSDGYYQKKYYINKSTGGKYIYTLCPYPKKGK